MTTLFLKKEERQVLFNKYLKAGYTREEAKKRINKISTILHKLVVKLNKQKKSSEYIKDKFQEEFAKLLAKNEIY